MKRSATALLLAVGPAGFVARGEGVKEAAPYGISRIVVQHTECYGACPVDSLTLDASGSATYANFARGGTKRGFFRGRIEGQKFAAMADFLQHLNYFALQPQMGMGNIDATDFLVSVTRNGQHYGVAFRGDGNVLGMQRRVEGAVAVADQMKWQRDEGVSHSGLVGWIVRPVTAQEAYDFRNDKPPTIYMHLRFARVELESLAHPSEVQVTRSDQEGRFQFFAAPGRYRVKVDSANAALSEEETLPIYRAEQTVEIKSGGFKSVDIEAQEMS